MPLLSLAARAARNCNDSKFFFIDCFKNDESFFTKTSVTFEGSYYPEIIWIYQQWCHLYVTPETYPSHLLFWALKYPVFCIFNILKFWLNIVISLAMDQSDHVIFTVDCTSFCKILTQTKMTDVLYCFPLYFLNFQEDIL